MFWRLLAAFEGYEGFFGVFVKRRVGVVSLAGGDVCSVRHSNVWGNHEAVQRGRFVYKEDGVGT